MLYVDIPSQSDIKALASQHADICVSIYLPTTPLSQDTASDRIELKNLAKEAERQLAAAGRDKRDIAATIEHLDDLVDDDEFWRFQARGLAVLATPDELWAFRYPETDRLYVLEREKGGSGCRGPGGGGTYSASSTTETPKPVAGAVKAR